MVVVGKIGSFKNSFWIKERSLKPGVLVKSSFFKALSLALTFSSKRSGIFLKSS